MEEVNYKFKFSVGKLRYPEFHYKKFISEEEKQKLEAFVNDSCGPQVRLVFRFMFKYGLRVGQATIIQLEDLDFNNRILHIKKFKTSKPYDLPIDEALIQFLRAYIAVFELDIKKYHGFLAFRKTACMHVTTSTCRWVMARFRQAFNLNDPYATCKDGKELHRICNHVLRHRAVDKVMDKTGDIRKAAALCGHSSPEITFRYYVSVASIEQMREVVANLN